ncbi:AbrB/MazE/SpoVT family DNA-binding domain-containing protein [Hydrogenibacillus sp. N12]|uniref:AbrB/MazE/SpoVT family DNA-binding domain-containing protein n=1 Tax=Hydrogenibacillus sp. N12 TaxID=2866627 RepID=UPI001C7DDFAF|nr:AbrB/MazE/SpoVT family DNA-binding domain-containing protein [Hydrogenibacillus sp. N12]QZA33054.1 AbrB/MazE/SpoVT family DNA-binding domain-containing protein [Hydrogenibacillus sp. N12]
MKATGIVRKVDELGRVVIPIELRRTLGIGERDALEIYVDGDRIVLRKLEARCVFCGSSSDLIEFRDKKVCRRCAAELGDAVRPAGAPEPGDGR